MRETITQLERVRARARFWLLMLRGSRWTAAVVAGALALGFADYLLRLPGGVRLVMLIACLGLAAWSGAKALGRALRVRPALTTLALRLERLTPSARGRLASAVAFSTHGVEAGEGEIADALAKRTSDEGANVVTGKQVASLLDPTHLMRAIVLMVIAVGVMGSVAAAAPGSFAIAVKRWAAPLGPTEWPNRYGIESAVQSAVAPNNELLRLRAQVVKGDYEGLRSYVHYRFMKDGKPVGDWQYALMTRQIDADRPGRYERQLQLASDADAVELYFAAGDDTSEVETVKLFEPPTLASLWAEVTPPGYAKDLVPVERHDLLQPAQPNVSIAGLAGSRVTLRVAVAGSFAPLEAGATTDALHAWVRTTLPELLATAKEGGSPGAADLTYDLKSSRGPREFDLSFTLAANVQFHFVLASEHATVNEDPRLFSIEAKADAMPRATVYQPASDVQVLPTAKVELAAEGHDDVAVASLAISSQVNQLEESRLASDEPTQPMARVSHELDLAPLKLKVGDSVAIAAVVRDNYLLDGAAHDPVRSTPRVIRIISEEELGRQLRVELAEIRQRAVRARANQSELRERGASAETAEQQRQLAERVGAMQRAVAGLRERIDQNRLEDDAIRQLLDDAGALTREASQEASQAAAKLERASAGQKSDPGTSPTGQDAKSGEQSGENPPTDENAKTDKPKPGEKPTDAKPPTGEPSPSGQQPNQPGRQSPSGQQTPAGQPSPAGQQQQQQQSPQQQEAAAEAKRHQEQAEQELGKLAELLDQGRDAYDLKQQATKMLKEQEELSRETREAMPRTLGQDKDKLNEQDRKELDRIATEQKELAEQAAALAERMRAAAAAIARQSQSPETQALSETLRNAAEKASEQSLSQQMQQASDKADQNQLAQAQQNQSKAEQTLKEMLDELNKTEQVKAEILRRKLNELVDAIRKLKERQEAHLDKLTKTPQQNLPVLEEPLVTLRRSTMSVSADAREAGEETAPIAEHIDAAAGSQGSAIQAFRLAPPDKPVALTAEQAAVDHLAKALELAEKAAEKANDELSDEERRKLQQEYAEALKQQQELNSETTGLEGVAANDRDRKWRSRVVQLGESQEKVRTRLEEIGKKVAGTIVFRDSHAQLDAWTQRSARRLRDASPDAMTLMEQELTAATIKSLIRALEPEKPSDEFDEGESDGGGGGGGSPSKPPLVPPIAEIKMLKERQLIVKELTRRADESRPAGEAGERFLDAVSDQQLDLANTSRQMLEALQREASPEPLKPIEPVKPDAPEQPGGE